MSRIGILCDYCKLDRCKRCDYECINNLSTGWQSFVRCKAFIEDDKQPLTNAEMISSLLKTDIENASEKIWLNTEISEEDFIDWLKEKSEEN